MWEQVCNLLGFLGFGKLQTCRHLRSANISLRQALSLQKRQRQRPAFVYQRRAGCLDKVRAGVLASIVRPVPHPRSPPGLRH
jgi:hypothetical protein